MEATIGFLLLARINCSQMTQVSFLSDYGSVQDHGPVAVLSPSKIRCPGHDEANSGTSTAHSWTLTDCWHRLP